MSTGLRRNFLLAALAYQAFVVYGSLVPLVFVSLPLDEALGRFAQIPYLELGIGSRADWVANLLLFIPLAWLWLGVLWRRGRQARNVSAGLFVVVAGAALSVSIEFTQVFFPPRTVSINDIVAETAGAVLGVGLWAWTGPAVWRWLEEWAQARGSADWATRVLYLYLAAFYIYSVLPLDLTISPVEIYRKWNSGLVRLLPLGTPYATLADAVYDMGADVLIWAPVAVLWRLPGRLTGLQVVLRVMAAATALETLQFFVFSRVTDTTDILTATAGGIVGVLLGGRLARTPAAVTGRRGQARAWGGWVLSFAGWLAIVALVFWYPFELRIERGFVTPRLQQLWRVPFETYYFGTEYRAITEVLHKLLFFMPGGALLAWLPARVPRGPLRGTVMLAAALALTGIALAVELGQVLMPGKVGDATDWFLETLGGLVGAVVAWQWLQRRAVDASLRAALPRPAPRMPVR